MYRETQRMDPALLKLVLALELPAVIIVLAALSQTPSPWWIYLVVAAGLAIGPLIVGVSRIELRLDGSALRWAFVPFWWSQTSLDDIEHLEVVSVQALKDFAGWGPKWKPGAFGLIAKSGGAVEITRKSTKTKLVITSDDPDRLADEILRRVLREEGIPMTETGP